MHCNNLRLVLGLGLVRVSSKVRVKVRVSVLVRVSIRTSWVVNFALFRCYWPVIYTRPVKLFVVWLYRLLCYAEAYRQLPAPTVPIRYDETWDTHRMLSSSRLPCINCVLCFTSSTTRLFVCLPTTSGEAFTDRWEVSGGGPVWTDDAGIGSADTAPDAFIAYRIYKWSDLAFRSTAVVWRRQVAPSLW